MLTSSLTVPWFLAAKKNPGSVELYIIGDSPEEVLPTLLNELNRLSLYQVKNFAFIQEHPRQKAVELVFQNMGWKSSTPGKAELIVGFTLLHTPARPSFTLIQDGRIRDLRSAKLYALWQQMQTWPAVRTLTTLTVNASFPQPQPGNTVAVRVGGQVIERLPLSRNIRRSLDTGSGRLTFLVDNGRVRVEESTCRHRVCVASSPVSLAGERIICAPNHFILEVEGRHWLDIIVG